VDESRRRCFARAIFRKWGQFIEIVSFEFFLTRLHLSNGGGVILARSLLSGLVVYFVVLGFRNFVDPARSWNFNLVELRAQVLDTMGWFGAVFAFIYAALYARFASQWTYLANVYNQIKASECRSECGVEPLAEWKAGFIEDAEELHLASKPLFASIIHAWAGDRDVKLAFIASAPGGAPRFETLMHRIKSVYEQTAYRAGEPDG
jgi:hypothetical protein